MAGPTGPADAARLRTGQYILKWVPLACKQRPNGPYLGAEVQFFRDTST
jgi:hypothetical protein